MEASRQIGNVQYSILEEGAFLAQNGPGWVLMQKQDIRTSQLSLLTGMTELPDGRGVFIRSMNAGRVEDGDPEANRTIASYQNDSLKSHTHSIINLGLFRALLPHQNWDGAEITSVNANQEKVKIDSLLRNESAGESETRPKNIALYLYIKIN